MTTNLFVKQTAWPHRAIPENVRIPYGEIATEPHSHPGEFLDVRGDLDIGKCNVR